MLEYRASSGSNELLVSFLESGDVSKHHEKAVILAERISDPKKRESMLNKLSTQ